MTNKSRKAQSFVPDEAEALNEIPEAITAGERLPHISEYSGLTLEAIPVKGLKTFFYSFGILLIALLGWEVYSVFKSALETHWLIAGGYAFLLLLIAVFGLRALKNFLFDQENISVLEGLQKQASRLAETHNVGNAKDFINNLKRFYENKPQMVHFQRCIDQLPDYSNDREAIDHIHRVFLQPLDNEALRRISNNSLQTGTVVAMSPWASLDMLLSLWRSIKMIDDIAQVYGIRPSVTNRYKLLKLVIHQLVFVGISEIVIDQVVQEFGSSVVTGMASARLAQGLGAGIYTARIGIAAMEVSRPIVFSNHNRPKARSVIGPMIEKLKTMMMN